MTQNAELLGPPTELASSKESQEKFKQQIADLSMRERVLIRRLAAKEQDIQEYASQLSEMKSSQVPNGAALKNALLDPAVNLLIHKLRQELASTKTKLEDTQNELAAWKFTPDSNTGKRLMAKCRLLYQENEELGRMISSGRLAKLEGDLALQKSFSEEVKKSQSELDELLQDLDEDVEGMQGTIYFLQQELRKSKERVTGLEEEISVLKAQESGKGLSEERDGESGENAEEARHREEPTTEHSYFRGINGVRVNGKAWSPREAEEPPDGRDAAQHSPRSPRSPRPPRTPPSPCSDSKDSLSAVARKRTPSETSNSLDESPVSKKSRPEETLSNGDLTQ